MRRAATCRDQPAERRELPVPRGETRFNPGELDAIKEALADLGLEVRAGLHTGECEIVDDKVAGLAVSIRARVAARAGPGEVLVSQTVKDLVAGSGLAFADRGVGELKDVPGEWRLFAVESA